MPGSDIIEVIVDRDAVLGTSAPKYTHRPHSEIIADADSEAKSNVTKKTNAL